MRQTAAPWSVYGRARKTARPDMLKCIRRYHDPFPEDDFPGPDFPGWIKVTARRVDELVSAPKVMGHFRNMRLREWSTAQRDKAVPDLPPIRDFTLPERYAVLAAVHDCVCKGKGVHWIDPWHIHSRSKNAARLRAGMGYSILVSQKVPQLKDAGTGGRRWLHGVLADVEDDLKARGLLPHPSRATDGKPATAPKRDGNVAIVINIPQTPPHRRSSRSKSAGGGRRGRKRKLDKTAQAVCAMIDNGDVERFARKWGDLLTRYASDLPKTMMADTLRKRVEREAARRASADITKLVK